MDLKLNLINRLPVSNSFIAVLFSSLFHFVLSKEVDVDGSPAVRIVDSRFQLGCGSVMANAAV